MLAEKIRRLFALLLAPVLVVGLVTHSVPVGNLGMKATEMPTAMSMNAATDMPSKCDGCAGDEKSIMPAACSAFCGSVVASPLMPAVFDAVPIATLWPPVGTVATGLTGPPDPYPPRPVVLS